MSTYEPKRRTGLAIGGIAVGLLAALVLSVAGLALRGEADKRDDAGYLSTHPHRIATATRAIATRDVTIGSEVPTALIGKVRFHATSQKPVFVGIARTADVDAYLAGASYAVADDVDADPFAITYVSHQGTRALAAPGTRSFWAASAVGAGDTSLTWKPRSGTWSVVVMNADASPGVAADVTAGVRVAWLLWAAIGAAIGGAILLAIAATMVRRALRRPSRPQVGVSPVSAH
jgi:hypothetical protein